MTTDKRSALSLPVARKGTQNWCLVFGLTGLNFGMLFLLFIWQGEHGLRELTRMFVGSPVRWGIASLNRAERAKGIRFVRTTFNRFCPVSRPLTQSEQIGMHLAYADICHAFFPKPGVVIVAAEFGYVNTG